MESTSTSGTDWWLDESYWPGPASTPIVIDSHFKLGRQPVERIYLDKTRDGDERYLPLYEIQVPRFAYDGDLNKIPCEEYINAEPGDIAVYESGAPIGRIWKVLDKGDTLYYHLAPELI